MSESLTSNSMLIPSLITSEQEGAKPLDASTAIIVTSTISNTTVGITTSTNTNTSKETGKKSAKDDKEPIQIIRGGRVITLPPIEAPATRSRRLQVKQNLFKNHLNLLNEQKNLVTVRNKGFRNPSNMKFVQT